MGWTKNYTDEFDENYPNSYWRVVGCNFDKKSQIGTVVFEGYEGQDKVGKRPIGTRSYFIPQVLYQQFFLPVLIQPLGIDHIKQCYVMSLAILDVDTGTKDADGNAIMASFFDGATDTN